MTLLHHAHRVLVTRQVDAIRDGVEYYIDSNQDADFYEVRRRPTQRRGAPPLRHWQLPLSSCGSSSSSTRYSAPQDEQLYDELNLAHGAGGSLSATPDTSSPNSSNTTPSATPLSSSPPTRYERLINPSPSPPLPDDDPTLSFLRTLTWMTLRLFVLSCSSGFPASFASAVASSLPSGGLRSSQVGLKNTRKKGLLHCTVLHTNTVPAVQWLTVASCRRRSSDQARKMAKTRRRRRLVRRSQPPKAKRRHPRPSPSARRHQHPPPPRPDPRTCPSPRPPLLSPFPPLVRLALRVRSCVRQ